MTAKDNVVSNERKTTWKIYWWGKTDQPKKYGSDIVTIEGDELTEADADDILSNAANTDKERIKLPNFEDYWHSANQCLDFGVRRIEQIKEN